MFLSLKYYTTLLCIICTLYYGEAQAKYSEDKGDLLSKPNKTDRINNGTLIRLAKYLSSKVTQGKYDHINSTSYIIYCTCTVTVLYYTVLCYNI